MPKVRIVFSLALVFIYLTAVLVHFVSTTHATVAACSANVSPTSMANNSSPTFSFSIQNTDSTDYVWIKITRPSADFGLTGNAVGGAWSASLGEESLTLENGTLAPDNTLNVNIGATVTNAAEATHNWTVQVSDDGGGAGAFGCTGTLTAEISGSGDDTFAPAISNITVVDITSSSVRVTWTTDEDANSVVDYGTTSSYGSTESDSALTTSHSITLGSLSASTAYYYRVKSTDADENTDEVSGNTFTTAAAGQTSSPQPATTTTSTTTTQKEDKEPPEISLSSSYSSPLAGAPRISGSVTDDVGVDSMNYSIDGGANWIAISFEKGASTTFSFYPGNLEDGNYDIVVKAKDASGKETTKTFVLIVDKLPPLIGGNVLFLGPQNLLPDADGTIVTTVGAPSTFVVSAIGGPIEVDFKFGDKTYPFTRIEGTNLWRGEIAFDIEGEFEPSVTSVDGAGNETERKLNRVKVLSQGKVEDKEGDLVNSAEVRVYVYSEVSKSWLLWEAGAFGQENPKEAREGKYGFLVPPGKYYLEVKAPGFRKAVSEIFETSKATVLNFDIRLEERPFFLPSFLDIGEVVRSFPVNLAGKDVIPQVSSHVGSQLPDLPLEVPKGEKAIISFLNIWSSSSQDQVPILDELNRLEGFRVFSIFIMEDAGRVQSFLNRGGYTLEAGVDKEGELIELLGITTLPQHFIIDGTGTIQKVIVGSKSEIDLVKIIESF